MNPAFLQKLGVVQSNRQRRTEELESLTRSFHVEEVLTTSYKVVKEE